MAKGNLFLGQARGKVGSVVFARAFGEQITRTRPTSVANPKTIGQNTQRSILATIAKSAALLTPIVDHSFANVAYGAESVRHFRKLNMGILRNMLLSAAGVNYNLSAKGAGVVPNALKISEGNLPPFSSSYQDDSIGFYMGSALSSIIECTVGDFLVAYPYLQGGDQLTLVKIVKTSGSLLDGDAVFAMKVDRVVFAPNAFADPDAYVLLDDGSLNPALLDLTKTTNQACIQGVEAGGGKGLGCATDGDDTYAAALILSRKVNNVWQRSTQYLELTEFDDMTDNQAAIDSYGETSALSEPTEYLNQADEGQSSQGEHSSYMQLRVTNDSAETIAASIYPGDDNTYQLPTSVDVPFEITVNGYAADGVRIVSTEITDPSNNVIAHGAKYCSVKKIGAAGTAGAYGAAVIFSDGTRALATITVNVS